MNPPLVFNPHIAQRKPSDKDACPFCQVDSLEHILAHKGSMIWLDNKYPVLEETYQTLIIESDQHLGDISNYSKEHNRALFAFAWQAWQELSASNRFKSVALFKNFGPLSGGSLRHPHMQVIGFEKLDAYEAITPQKLTGHLVCENKKVQVTLSDEPMSNFSEFNVTVSSSRDLDDLADTVQKVVQYVLTDYLGGRCDSYNLFFYRQNQAITCKVVPRFVTSPYFIGYHLSQINTQRRIQEEIAELSAFITANH